MLPLAHLTVVALEQAVAAPYATRHLADLGARVIKIERPDGGDFARHYDAAALGQSAHFVWANRGKQSLALDVKTADGQTILEQLIGRADVFIHNLGPGAVERLGLAAERLRAAYPRLVVCQISGYGAGGPYRNRRAYDMLIQAEAGLLSVTGTADETAKVGIPIADIAAGMYAYSGILAALLARATTGEGALIDISMLEALAEWMGFPLAYALSGSPPPRAGNRHPTIAPYEPFTCADGRSVILAVQNDREWARLCEQVLERPDLVADARFAHNPDRVAHRPTLRVLIADALRRIPHDEALRRLDAARIACAEARTLDDVLDHPQLTMRQRWRAVPSPNGLLPMLIPPGLPDGQEPAMGAIPALGAHTDVILRELGYDDDALGRLRAQRVIG